MTRLKTVIPNCRSYPSQCPTIQLNTEILQGIRLHREKEVT